MRSLLAVSCVVLIYVVGLMTATGTSLWTAAVSDQEAAAVFGGACLVYYNGISCSTASSSCKPLTCYALRGTTQTIRSSDRGEQIYCTSGTDSSCSSILLPYDGCLTGG